MNELVQLLHTDHANLVQVLDLLDREIDALEAGRDSGFEKLTAIGAYCLDYPGISHHPVEEAIGARLAELAPEVAESIGDVGLEHDQLEAATRQFVATVAALAAASMVPRDEAVQGFREFSLRYRQHIDWEESELFPAAEQCFNEREWRAIQAAMAERTDPAFDADARASYQSIRESLLSSG